MITKLLSIMFIMIFTENYVLVQFLGICPFLGVSKKFDSAIGMTGAVVFVMTLASAVTFLIYKYVMVPAGLEYLSTIIFILVIAALVQFVEIFLKKYAKGLYQALGIYLPLITTNCIVLAATLLNVDNGYVDMSGGFLMSVVNGLSAGIGFGVALILFCGVRQALENAKPPKCFEGLPITMVAAALTSVTFMGFTGMAENLFH
jgi:electron transport complex protein RnfA